MTSVDPTSPGPYAHIACCLEDSAGSRLALAEARRLRALGPGRLSVVHVATDPLLFLDHEEDGTSVDPRDLQAASARWLEREMAEIPEGEPALLHGAPAAAVCAWAREARPDLIVAGAHRSRTERALLGSFAAHLAHHAPCPVLLVRPPEYEAAGASGPAEIRHERSTS